MSSRQLPYLPYLDGLRAVAVLLVLWAHFPFVTGSFVSEAFWKISQALRTGYIGVDLFFVMSGFLITRILLNERLSNGTISFRRFYINRALRIFPIYYICIAIYALLYARHDGDLLSLVTYTFNVYKPLYPDPVALEHTWSLSVEEQFYLAWPFVMAAIPLRMGKAITGIVIPAISFAAALLVAECVESSVAANVDLHVGGDAHDVIVAWRLSGIRRGERRPARRRTCARDRADGHRSARRRQYRAARSMWCLRADSTGAARWWDMLCLGSARSSC